MKTNEIREQFLAYFEKNGHAIVPGASLIPANDPTLLFVNAGMVQFKEVFLGVLAPPAACATSAQLSLRAGGKHNDLDNVGYTARHHTLFEMLGNFSFGDYFKREAITLAWTFLTEVLGLSPEKLWVTVYEEDSESEAIWLEEMKVDPQRFSRCGEKDNFWSMGETGPCGPCTEIFYDHGPAVPGGPPGSPEEDGDRYVEIWNLVFMQYNRDKTGKLTPLPKQSVDTGMGLERIAAVLQGVHSNYDIDLFQALLTALSKILGHQDTTDTSMRVIVDHIRSTAFLIADGVLPSNEGRGYVLRRIIRRALRHGYQLGERKPFFHQLVPALSQVMGEAYPQLLAQQDMIQTVILQEEEQFLRTLAQGIKLIDAKIEALSGTEIPGDTVFVLYDTYGFPPDLTADIARERGLTIDETGFNACMAEQRARSQAHQRFNVDQAQHVNLSGETTFLGYENQQANATIQALLFETDVVKTLTAGQAGVVVLDRTPFYAESGGQVGDTGLLVSQHGRFQVKDTQKKGAVILHWGEMLEGQLQVGDALQASVHDDRQAIRANHSATHLLHEALRQVLGAHVVQKGSLVEAKRLRFDFVHQQPLTRAQLQEVEHWVNAAIRANQPATLQEMSLAEAKESGAMALFGEKYAGLVRVITMGDFSCEICGGTHVDRTGDIGFFKITNETASSAGVRRLEAVTGEAAVTLAAAQTAELEDLSGLLKTGVSDVADKLGQLLQQAKSQQREIQQLQQKLAAGQSASLLDQVQTVKTVSVLAVELPGVDREAVRSTIDQLKQKFSSAAIVLATVKEGKVQLVAAVTKDCLPHFNATQLLNQVAKQVGGKGGGRPELAQGGGDQPEYLGSALGSVAKWVATQLGE